MILGSFICCLLTYLTYRYVINKFSIIKNERKSFYECGFKPNTQKPALMSIQFFLICILFILFDTDLLFLYPFITNNTNNSFIDLCFFIFIIILLFYT